MFIVLRQARIALDGDIACRRMRQRCAAYEGKGLVPFLITEEAWNFRDFFDPGHGVVVYVRVDELVENIGEYLDSDDERSMLDSYRSGI